MAGTGTEILEHEIKVHVAGSRTIRRRSGGPANYAGSMLAFIHMKTRYISVLFSPLLFIYFWPKSTSTHYDEYF